MTLAIARMIEETSIKHDKLLKKITQPLQQHLGVDYFCYQFVSHEGQWFTLGNKPKWLLYSAESQFYQLDPSLAHPKHYQSGVCLPEYHNNNDFEVMRESAATHFDLNHTLAIIEPNAYGCEYYFFAAPKQHKQVINHYLKNLTQLRNDYTRYVKENIQPIYHHALSHSVDLNILNPNSFHETHNILLTEPTLHENDFLLSLPLRNELTHREQQCLHLFKQGYTAKESARQLGISYRTIEKHFEAIKRKLAIHHKRDFLK